MNLKLTFAALWLGVSLLARAEVLPPEKLLPADTLGLLTVPDWDKAVAAYKTFPLTQFWHDPAMKAFTDKFNEKLKSELIVPLERELGVKLEDYADLVHGQFTIAVTQNGWTGQTNQLPGLVVLIDVKDKGEQLKKTLADLKKKWIDGGKKIKTETIRDVEFSTLIINPDDISKTMGSAFPGAKKDADEPKGEPTELTIGQSGSLLLVGNAPKDFEKILARQAGGLVASLAEEPSYEANHAAMFREALVYGWVNYQPIGEIVKKQLSQMGSGAPGNDAGGPSMPRPDKILSALGIDALKTVAFKINHTGEGMLYDFFVGVPEGSRRGLVKTLAPEAKDSAPPSFVPADTAKFNRWRLDGQKLWATIEGLIKELVPSVAGIVQMTLDNVGKDKDPNFDMKKQLIGNLGDDLIMLEKAPRSTTAKDIGNPPSLYLIGSPNPEQLVVGIKVVSSMLPPQMSNLKEREFLGRKIYSFTLPPVPGPDGKTEERGLHFASGGGYVAMTTDVAMIEEYLRSSESKGKALLETAGLGDAAQKIGGMGTGWFGYDNQTETFRTLFETLKQDPKAFQKMFSGNPFEPQISKPDDKGIATWFDYSLLPPFTRVAKYFHFSVFAGSSANDGIHFKVFSPTPPELKK